MSKDVTATLSFLEDDPKFEREKPFQIISGLAGSKWASNCRYRAVSGIPIRDCRDQRDSFRLDTHGFEFWDWKCTSDNLSLFSAAPLIEKRSAAIEPYLLEV